MSFNDGALNKLIYGDWDDKSFYYTLIQHDYAKTRQEKFMFKRLDLDYHFRMCEHTKGFQSRYHMSENAFNSLVDILRQDIAPNVIKSRNSTSNNEPITKKVVTCCGLCFMGGKKLNHWVTSMA